ncbi:MAG TPA: aminopeptidase [Firmicutes bacterium]|nr:aminopeptidase [Bacillota bacterium]
MSILTDTCKRVLVTCMGLLPGESVAVISDTGKKEIGSAFLSAAFELGNDAVMVVMKPRNVSGEEPPDAVAQVMRASDVVLCPTTRSLTHTRARTEATAAGARIATMPGITEEMFYCGGMTADYGVVKELTAKVASLLDAASHVRIVKEGHELNLSLKGRKAVADTGHYLRPGEWGNLPAGEAYVAPVEGTAEGELYIDVSVAGVGKLSSPLLVSVRGGIATDFSGGEAHRLAQILEDGEARNVAELGIGTNPRARLTGIIVEDEKAYGTIHVAFGENAGFGGKVRAGKHIDCVISKPDLYLDGQLVIRAGQFLF